MEVILKIKVISFCLFSSNKNKNDNAIIWHILTSVIRQFLFQVILKSLPKYSCLAQGYTDSDYKEKVFVSVFPALIPAGFGALKLPNTQY